MNGLEWWQAVILALVVLGAMAWAAWKDAKEERWP
jgi:hypothetical protein